MKKSLYFCLIPDLQDTFLFSAKASSAPTFKSVRWRIEKIRWQNHASNQLNSASLIEVRSTIPDTTGFASYARGHARHGEKIIGALDIDTQQALSIQILKLSGHFYVIVQNNTAGIQSRTRSTPSGKDVALRSSSSQIDYGALIDGAYA